MMPQGQMDNTTCPCSLYWGPLCVMNALHSALVPALLKHKRACELITTNTSCVVFNLPFYFLNQWWYFASTPSHVLFSCVWIVRTRSFCIWDNVRAPPPTPPGHEAACIRWLRLRTFKSCGHVRTADSHVVTLWDLKSIYPNHMLPS